MDLHVGTYAGDRHLAMMQCLLLAVRPRAWAVDFPSPVDLQELLGAAANAERTRMWLDPAGSLRAFALVDAYGNLWFELDPKAATSTLEDEVIAWGIACVSATDPSGWVLDTNCREEASERVALLRRHGFEQQDLATLVMERSLADPIPEPILPAGFVLRPLQGRSEVGEVVRLHQRAFASNAFTGEERLSTMRLRDYEPALDLVVVAPDGKLAAACMAMVTSEENALSGRTRGALDPVGTDPNHRRRGLARALLCAGMIALKARGVEVAFFHTSSTNQAMAALGKAAGFRQSARRIWFSKSWTPDTARASEEVRPAP